jgi:CheY-like chemotaxis protein
LNKENINFTINTKYDPSQTVILTDVGKLKQVLINLINNAFKFTLKGEIETGCYLNENSNLVFYVFDTGVGISKENQTFIFQRFTQINNGGVHNLGGTGLGLAIVKGIIELLGGEIWLESEPGIGSKFYFTMPYKIDSKLVDKQKDIKISNFQFYNKTLLIVEDDAYNSAYLMEILSNSGFNILHSGDGKQAVELANNQHIDIILIDVRLPDMEGYEVTQIIKSKKPEIKIIAQTAYATIADKQKAFDSGCDDYISKPVNKNKLLRMIYDQLTNAKS